jgi:hypothetical protein
MLVFGGGKLEYEIYSNPDKLLLSALGRNTRFFGNALLLCGRLVVTPPS